jgi:NAD+ synthase (glutamine-hydrolysing)
VRVALGQINTTVGDFAGNVRRILEVAREARARGADIVLLPECAVCGYPPRDLLQDGGFLAENARAVREVARAAPDLAVVVGFAERNRMKQGKPARNAAAICRGGRVVGTYRKCLLPAYDVFDEERNFEPGHRPRPHLFDESPLAITICEDIWNDPRFWPQPLYGRDPVQALLRQGSRAILNISASPWTLGKARLRFEMLQARAVREGVPVAYCNQVGGNDDLVFDGNSFAVDAQGRMLARAKAFEEDVVCFDLFARGMSVGEIEQDSDASRVRPALVLGLRDYMRKCGFTKAVLGLSGGIDSAVTAAVAVEALGANNVLGVAMPSPFSSAGSLRDAEEAARRLGMEFQVVPIEPIYNAYLDSLAALFEGRPFDVTEENIQARIRGDILMAISNKFGHIVLSTGNKSEVAVGYCTLYGDMSGGLSVLSDVPKTLVYEVAAEINSGCEVIPGEIIKKPPSAELRPDQKDSDSLPPYEVLDPILRAHVEELLPVAGIVARGYPREVVERIIAMVERNEYKRGQAPPGIKVTSKAFGTGRRMPIAKVRTSAAGHDVGR